LFLIKKACMISRAYFYYLKYKKNEKYQRLWRECISKVSYFVSVHTLRMQMKLLCNRNDKKRERTIICNWWLAHMTSDMRRAKNMTGVGTADMKVWAKILSLKSFWIPSALVTGGQVKKNHRNLYHFWKYFCAQFAVWKSQDVACVLPQALRIPLCTK